MPPHCDALDGPVVVAAQQALEMNDVNLVLPFVSAAGDPEVRTLFAQAVSVRGRGPDVAAIVDRWFFENVVRIHRAGEGAPYTGVKPAGLDVGPVIPAAERALDTGSADELTTLLSGLVAEQVKLRLDQALHRKANADSGVAAARAYVQSALGLQVWSHRLYLATTASAHDEADGHSNAAIS